MISNGISFFFLSCLSGVYVYFYFRPAVPQKPVEVDINEGNMTDGLNQRISSPIRIITLFIFNKF